ncbi:hypothetical protein A4D02_25695 [Niastella koreensis]|uniref:Uncharacterized protein n=1 Tax=Niastella koreensis TaxID=354356 RepID=A0ABX3P3G2_9BACT|nr:hypothetical protein A4D02_25695 [Niastella koreensis]
MVLDFIHQSYPAGWFRCMILISEENDPNQKKGRRQTENSCKPQASSKYRRKRKSAGWQMKAKTFPVFGFSL